MHGKTFVYIKFQYTYNSLEEVMLLLNPDGDTSTSGIKVPILVSPLGGTEEYVHNIFSSVIWSVGVKCEQKKRVTRRDCSREEKRGLQY